MRTSAFITFYESPRGRKGSIPSPGSEKGCKSGGNQEDLLLSAFFYHYSREPCLTVGPTIKLARKYHPDTNPDKSAQAKFLEIQEAYDVSLYLTFPSGDLIKHV